jgi:hypothetical protein
MKISNDFLESLSSIKVKGYVNVEEVEYPTLFINKIEKHLVGLGYKLKSLGVK